MTKTVTCDCSKKAKQLEKHLRRDMVEFREYMRGNSKRDEGSLMFDAGYVHGQLELFEGAGCSLTPKLKGYRNTMVRFLEKTEGGW